MNVFIFVSFVFGFPSRGGAQGREISNALSPVTRHKRNRNSSNIELGGVCSRSLSLSLFPFPRRFVSFRLALPSHKQDTKIDFFFNTSILLFIRATRRRRRKRENDFGHEFFFLILLLLLLFLCRRSPFSPDDGESEKEEEDVIETGRGKEEWKEMGRREMLFLLAATRLLA